MKLLAIAAAIGAIAATDVSAKCAMTELEAVLLTPAGTKLPSDGGLVVGFTHEVSRDYSKPRKTGDPSLTDWKFSVAVTKDTIAPGLTVYRPTTGAKLDVKDAKGNALGSFTRDEKSAPVAAAGVPRVSKLELTTHSTGRGFGRTATATSSDPIPNDAAYVIVYDAKGKAISYGVIPKHDLKLRTFVPWTDPSRCAFNPETMVAPATGTKVTFAWVDAYGRVGKQSGAVTVTEVKPSKDLSDED